MKILCDSVKHNTAHAMIFAVQHGTLRQRTRHLMHALYAEICARQKRPGRQSVMKIQMPSMRFIDQQKGAMCMTNLCDRSEIRTHAIITRAHQKQRFAVRIFHKGFLDRRRCDFSLYAPRRPNFRHHIHRLRPRQNQAHQR